MNERYEVNSAKIAHETIDGEVIIVHLENGAYYSIENTGSDVWSLINQGATVDQIVDGLVGKYEGDPKGMRAAVEPFVRELAEEELIMVTASTNVAQPALSYSDHKTTFAEPVLEKYLDLQELLLLDPIHEVTDEGWPKTP